MKLHYKRGKDLIFIDKPTGFSTHATDPGKPGIVEFYEQQLGQKLYVVHRLDKSTSGCMAFATSPERAQELVDFFKLRQVKKKYLFITDRPSAEDQYSVYSKIEKNGKTVTNHPCSEAEANAITHFQRLKRSPFFELWQATPLTGKTHQIRLHAQTIELPILGDPLYGGSPFPDLCLHSLELQIPGEDLWTCPPPRYFERLGLLKDPELVRWLSQVDRRQRLFNFLQTPQECLRLIHSLDFRLDLYGPQLWAYWYHPKAPGPKDILRMETLADILNRPWLLKMMQDRGQDPHQKTVWKSHDKIFTETWKAQEGNLEFEFRENSGQSAGLFLDQREHRQTIKAKAKDLKVLNLFSYTCGFSVAAAAGGARQVTSVDASSNFLNWGKENFVLNSLDIAHHEFFTQDVLLFLGGCVKRRRQFDLIVCDPPSFGRFKKQVFRLEKDLAELLHLLWNCLAPSTSTSQPGQILFSCNLEKWSPEDMMLRIKKILPNAKLSLNSSSLDYELPGEAPLMKSIWIQKS